MSKNDRFFYYGDSANEKALRRSPSEKPTGAVGLSAPHTLVYGEEEEAYAALTAEILERLASPYTRKTEMKKPASLASVFSLIAEYCTEYPSVTALPPSRPSPTVAVCAHDLYFCVATVIHGTAALPLAVTISTEQGEAPAICLSAEVPTVSEQEAAAAFGLLSEGRLAILKRIAEASGFAVTLRPGDVTSVVFSLTPFRSDVCTVLALTDPTLYTAYLLPTEFFHF